MVRETRHLWVGNLPENIREDRIREHFKRYGRVQSVKLLPPSSGTSSGSGSEESSGGGGGGLCATVAFMDIKSASKAHTAEHKLDERSLTTEYYEPPTASMLHLHEPQSPASAPASGGTSTSAGATLYPPRSPRFPPHGPAEETFERSSHFYRGGSVAAGAETETSSGYLPRRGGSGAPAPAGPGPAYHAAAATSDGLRGRARDRQQAVYRNGPTYPPSHLETGGRGAPATSHHRAGSGGGSAWNYDGVAGGGVRYPSGGDPEEPPLAGTRQPAPCTPSSPATAAATSPSQAAPPAPAALLTLSSASASAARKSRHAKRRRGTARAAVTSGGVSDSEHSSGRGSRSSSRSSCSSSHSTNSSSSSCSSPSSSPGGSPGTRGQRASSRLLASMPPPSCGTGSHHNSSSSSGSGATHADDRRPLAICVRNLPARSSDTSLKDGLFHEYKKHGKVTWVKVVGSGSDRYALVCFKKPEDVDKALEVSHDKLFFGCKIDVAPYEGFDVDDNDFRVCFVDRPYEAELDEFHPKATRTLFIGNLEKDVTAAELRKHFEQFGEIIEIDIKKQGSVSSYAFCQYADIGAVVAAMRSMDGEHLGNNRIKLGFGKSMPTNCVWVDGVAESVSEKYLSSQFNQFGIVAQVSVDRARGHALVFFEQLSCAQAAVKELRGVTLQRRRLQLDFASRECQEAFYAHLEKQGCSPGTWERPPAATFDAREVTAPRFESVPPAVTTPNARFPRYEAGARTTRGGGAATAGPHPAHRGGSTTTGPTTRPNRNARQPPHPRFDYYDEFTSRFRSSSGEEYIPGHEDGGSYEQELRDYGFCQRERRTDYPAGVTGGDLEHSPSPAQLVGSDDVTPEEPAVVPARRHSRQHSSTTSDHGSPPPVRLTSPPPASSKRLSGHSRLLSCSPRTPYYEDKEESKCKDLSPSPSSIISGSKCDLSGSGSAGGGRGPHRHNDGKEPPPLPSLSSVTRRHVENDSLPPPSNPVTEGDMTLHKERVHLKQLFDQIESNDSAAVKRVKLTAELKECSDGKDFRRIEPRRLSDLKGRRISTDSFSGKMGKDDKYHHRADYAPHFIPKRRKTESSSEGGEGLHRDSSDGSRPGTPLCDERPECLVPSEPRRPRDRPSEGPISLPLPRFAHQLLTPRPGCGGPGKIVYTIKSPPPLPPNRHRTEQAPLRCEEKREPAQEAGGSEVPLSPSRPDSSSESERSPRASPIQEEQLDERLRMFDEKYQKWSGSRLSFSSEKTDTEKFKLRTKLPDLNELRNQPSEIVKSVLAKRSVFDEDTKRLENYNEKYEPKEFPPTSWRSIAAASSSTVSSSLTLATSIQNSKTEAKSGESWVPSTSTVSTIPLPTSSPSSSSCTVTSPKSILVTSRSVPKSPFTTGTPTIPVVPPKAAPTPQAKPVMTPKTSAVPSPATSPRPSAKGLQYPFPSHPPVSSPVSLVPGSPRCQPPLSSPVQCSPAALDSGDWPPAQPPCLPTPPPSACGSPCIPPSTPAPPPSQPEESKSPPAASKTPVKKENNVLNATARETVVASPAKSSASTSSTPSLPSPSSSTSSLPPSTTSSATPAITTTTTTTVVKKEPITTVNPTSTTLSPPPPAPVVPTPKVEPPPTPEKAEKPEPPPVVNCVHRKESSTPASKKESNGHKTHKSHSQDGSNQRSERRESVEERPRQKERRDSGKEHRPANVGNKRRISSQDEPRHTPAAAVEAPTATGQPETKRPKLSSSSSSEKSIEKVSTEKPAEKHTEKVVAEKPSEKPSEKSSSNPKPAVKVAPERRESKDSVRRVESSSSSSSSSSNKRSEERRKHDKDKDRKSEEKTKVSDEKSSSHSERSKSHSSEKKAPENERHRSKERKRSKSERDRPRTEEKSARPRDEFRSKHETDDKNKKQRDKKSDRSSRRSESERRKERSTPKKSTSQSQASTPAQPSAPASQHPAVSQQPAPQQQPQQQAAQQQQSGQMQSNQQQALQHQQHQHQQSMMPRDSAASDSDLSEDGRMKKHSIFDIVDDEPAYISMYDKVKARSTKNMQKQEEEKQKEKLKEKFNQLKQSRAKREEKKRSTSWDEDSDSDGGHHHHHKQQQERPGKTPKRPGKLVITSSSEDEGHNSRRRLLSDISHTDKSESEGEVLSRNKQRKSKLLKSEQEGSDEDNEEGSARTKLMHTSRRNFKPKITSDTSDYDEAMQQQQQQQQKYKPAFDIYSDSDDKHHHTMSTPIVAKVKVKESSRETFESSDEGKFDNKKHYDLAKFKHEFSENEAPNCIDKQPRKSHKSKRRPSGKSNCVEQPQMPVDDLEVRLERIDDAKPRLDHKQRPSEEKQVTPQPSGIDHKRSSAEPATNEYKRSSTESEHKRHSSSRRERRRSGHHEDKDETETKTSSRARKKKSKKDAVAKQEPSSKQRDDKMEDIFGPISDDSETGTANQTFHTDQSTTKSSNAANNNNNTQTYNPCPRKWQFNSVYSSDSDSNVDNAVIHRTSPSLPQLPEFEVENFGALDVNTSLKRSEERRRKRERRRSKERREKRLQREIRAERTDEELAEAGRVLENQLQTECSPPPPPPVPPPPVMPRLDEFRFTDEESVSAESCERPKEKKKKRKRSKEERSRKDHHEKSSKSSESERKSSRGSEEPCSLPNLLPSPTSPAKVFSPEAKSFPKHFDDDDTLPATEVVHSKPVVEKKRPDMKLIPGFGSEVDANIHETAVKSISSFTEEPVPIPEPAPTPPVVLLCPEPEEKEDKPRTVISQEETEDAVAALLEEKFDFAHYIDDGDEEEVPHELHQEHVEPVLAAVQDEEQLASEEAQKETQQAVQSLECELPTTTVAPVVTEPLPEEESKDAERADTPQSEHDLQIDESAQPCSEDEAPVSPPAMPTLEQEEIEEPVSCPSPDTPEMMDFSRPPKTPDFPAAYYQQQQQQQQQLEATLETSLEKPVEEKLAVKEEEEVKETVVETPVVPPVTEVVKPTPSPEPPKPVEKPAEEAEVKKEEEVVPEPVKKVEEPELKVPEITPKEEVEDKVLEEKVVETTEPVLPKPEEKPVAPVEVAVVEPVKPEVKIEVTPPEPSPPVVPVQSVAPMVQKVEEPVEVKKEVVEPETVTPALLEVPQSPLRVRKVELSAPLIRDLAAQALQEAAATTPVPVPQAPATPVAAEEHEVPSHTEDETEEKVGETINTRCITRRGGRSRRGSKAVSRGGVSTRRTARGGGRTPRSDTTELSHTEESAEEKSGDITSPEHSQRGRKSRRGRKKKSVEPESGDDKAKSKMSSDTNDIYEFHDTDDEDLHYKSKPGEKISAPVPAATVPTTTVSPPVPAKVEEASTVAPTPPAPEEPVPEVPQQRRDSTTDDAASRPRLILTIKSPLKEGAAKVETREEFEQVAPPEAAATLVPAEPQATAPSPTPAIQQSPQPSHVAMNVKSPPGPTRKSRRLQEKDSSRSTVDDIIEEVIKGNFRAEEGGPTSPLHEARGGVTTRRSGRATRLQRGSEEPPVPPRAARASSVTRPEEEKQQQQPQQQVAPPPVVKIELPKPAAVATAPSPAPPPQQQAPQSVLPPQKPQTARASPPVPGRAEEPTTLIDPVTGLLTPMRESGEGQYIPVTTSVSVIQAPPPQPASTQQQEHVVRPPVAKVEEIKPVVPVRTPETPVQPPMQQQQAPRPPSPAPQRLPSATVAPAPRLVPPPPQVQTSRPVQQVSPTVVKLFNATTTVPPPTPAITVVKVQQPAVVSRPPVASTATYAAPPRVSEMGPGAPYPPWPTQVAPHTSPSRMSPLQQQTAGRPTASQPPPPHIPMAHASSLPSKQHLMETVTQPPPPQGARPCLPQPAHSASAPERREHRRAKEEELPLSMLPPRLRVGAVARTSAAAALPAPACSNTSPAEPPRVEVGLGGCIVASGAPAQPRPPRARSRESPVGGGRPSMGHTATHSQVLQAGLPVPAYEASLHVAGVPASPELQQQPSHLLPPPLPPPTQQAQQHGGLTGAQVIERVPNRQPHQAGTTRSPPPAHQQGESVRASPGQHAAVAAAVAAGFAPVAHLQQRPHDMAAQLMHNQQFIYQQLLRAQHEQQQLGPPPPSSAYHHQPYHLPPGPPGAARSPAVPGLDVKAEPPEASDEALALGPRGSRAPPSPPLELRRTATNARLAAAHLHSPHDRTTDSPQVATVYGARLVHHPHQGFQPRGAESDKLHGAPLPQPHRSNYMAPPQHPRYEEDGIFHHAPPPPAHHQRGARGGHPTPGQEAPLSHPTAAVQQPRLQVQTPPHASQVPPQADSLLMLLQRYPVVWQGLLALKNDQAAVQMHFVHGNPHVARNSLPCNSDGSTPPLRIAQRMRLEQTQLEGVARKMQMEQEHCMLLALPCGRDHMDVLQQSNNLKDGFITYLQQKQAAGIVNIAVPGSQQAAYVIHIFPSSDFANDNLARIAPDLLHRVSDLSHLLIIIATV